MSIVFVPPFTGNWHADVSANGKIPETHAVLEIGVDGRYRFRRETRESGLWEPEGGKWTRNPQDAPAESGTYAFDGRDTVTTAGRFCRASRPDVPWRAWPDRTCPSRASKAWCISSCSLSRFAW